MPNTSKYPKVNYRHVLLDVLDSLDIPFTIFINEDKIYKTDSINKNKQLLERWIENKQATIGNHTYSHLRYSDVGFNLFIEDIKKGAYLSKMYSAQHRKPLKYFRFPFNDLGKDSIQHAKIREYLLSEGYIIAPFIIESSDWMFNYVYQHYRDNGLSEKAEAIGHAYVDKTIELVKFFEEMAFSIHGRQIKHIYLCHDNAINADYLSHIIARLKQDGYRIVSFEESLSDTLYKREDAYFKKWGISWLYRWMDSQEDRVKWMRMQPDVTEIQTLYEELAE